MRPIRLAVGRGRRRQADDSECQAQGSEPADRAMDRVYGAGAGCPLSDQALLETDRVGDQLRPGLQPVPRRRTASARRRSRRSSLSCSRTSTGAAIGLDLEDDAEVDGADRVRVVVQEADQLELGLPAGHQLLGPLATQAGHERILALVDRVEVAADPDARLAMQPRIAAGIGALHQEDALRRRGRRRTG